MYTKTLTLIRTESSFRFNYHYLHLFPVTSHSLSKTAKTKKINTRDVRGQGVSKHSTGK